MQSEGRRAFLRGRRPPSSPWDTFCRRLRDAVSGTVTILDSGPDKHAAHLLVKKPTDAHHARSLCAEFGVSMALDGVPAAAEHDGPVLWVRPGHEVGACRSLDAEGKRWFVQPGCLL